MINYEKALEMVSIKDLLNNYGIKIEFADKVKCPFHDDNVASAKIYSNDKEWFHCFACGVNYNAIDFVANYEKCTRGEALAKIDAMFGLGLTSFIDEREAEKISARIKRRDRARKLRQQKKAYEKKLKNKVVDEILLWENIRKDLHITRGEYRKGVWENENIFFFAIKRLDYLNWLYDVLCDNSYAEKVFDYVYGTNKNDIIKKIKKGDMII